MLSMYPTPLSHSILLIIFSFCGTISCSSLSYTIIHFVLAYPGLSFAICLVSIRLTIHTGLFYFHSVLSLFFISLFCVSIIDPIQSYIVFNNNVYQVPYFSLFHLTSLTFFSYPLFTPQAYSSCSLMCPPRFALIDEHFYAVLYCIRTCFFPYTARHHTVGTYVHTASIYCPALPLVHILAL
ncbi:hypothetical protein K435DRAFT_263254 [Dendrothele bispora CBS 962.96]|uniref:Uncharacterized protein n=1 Tax=Dendrothele bispora (strain CBS 962.96) TaxID=1314807 RepID=A0A4S8MY41_DENBC|nr:hypothetical protein K435DRAFT_263254 [Dendrothele bispora CBS 962.96]